MKRFYAPHSALVVVLVALLLAACQAPGPLLVTPVPGQEAAPQTAPAIAESSVPPAPNGIALPQGYRDWQVIGLSHRSDNNTLRVIVGNEVAVEAARSGNTNPWPAGTILGKMVWRDATHEAWETATVPGEFVHAEFMIKDPQYAETGGWGYARWLGTQQEPFGEDATFVQQCHACHTPVADNDFVFTTPVILP